MTEVQGGARGRAVRGIEAAAFVLRHVVETYAVVGGEGARRLEVALGSGQSGPERLEGEGLDAARAAVGSAAAGKRTALIASGEAVMSAWPALREMVRLGLPVLVVIPSHGPEVGAPLPLPGFEDVAVLNALPMGMLVAADAGQVGDFLLAAQRAAMDRGAPWAVVFDLASVGLSLTNAVLPSIEQMAGWIARLHRGGTSHEPLVPAEKDLERHRRDVERYAFAIGAAMRDLERLLRRPVAPVIATGCRDAELVVVSVGASSRAVRQVLSHLQAHHGRSVGALQVASFRPFPADDVVRHAWRARAVVVHESFPEPLGTGGALSDAVRASFADALTWHPSFTGIGRIPPVVTVLGSVVTAAQWVSLLDQVSRSHDPPRLLSVGVSGPEGSVETRIDIAMDESAREDALRLVVDWLARAGMTVSAHVYEPTRATVCIARPEVGRGPAHVMLVCAGAVYDTGTLQSLPSGALVVLAGDFPDKVLAETMRAGASRGIRVATLGGHGMSMGGNEAVVAVVRAMVSSDGAGDVALEHAARDMGVADPGALVAQVRVLSDSLRAHFQM